MLCHCAYIVTLVPSLLRWRLAETKPGARRTETSVASVRSSTRRRWFAGSTVNTLIRVITLPFAEIWVMPSPLSGRAEIFVWKALWVHRLHTSQGYEASDFHH